MAKPAEVLERLTLKGKHQEWVVKDRFDRSGRGSGGSFSTSYLVEGRDGTKAFLKAMDYAKAFSSDDVPRALQILTATFNFERDLLAVCLEHNMSRIVRVLDEGQVDVEGSDFPVKTVNFLIFELAKGDVSCQVDTVTRLDTAVAVRTLHCVAIGLQQLHTRGITHQDVRPSNILQFQEAIAKLADLGRAGSTSHNAPHDEVTIPGFIEYAPPECLYKMNRGRIEIHQWRRAGDLYLLGSMIYFMFEGQMLTPIMQSRLGTQQTATNWTDGFEAALPFYRNIFGEIVETFADGLPETLRTPLRQMIRELCEPDPRLRGHPKDRHLQGAQYSLERFISALNVLAARAEYQIRK
jgi:serine/threonine protein kinase